MKFCVFSLLQTIGLAVCFSVYVIGQSDKSQLFHPADNSIRFYDDKLHAKIINEVKVIFAQDVLAYGAAVPVDVTVGVSVLVALNTEGKVIAAQPVYGFSQARDAAIQAILPVVFPIVKKQGISQYLTTITVKLADKDLGGNVTYLDKYLIEVKTEPQSWVAHSRLANAYLRAGISKRAFITEKATAQEYLINAEAEITKAITLSPTSSAAYHTLGWVYETTGRYQEALNAYQEAIKNNPKFVEAIHRAAIMGCVLDGISYKQFVDEQAHLEGVAIGYRKDERWVQHGFYRGSELWLPREPIYFPNPNAIKNKRGRINQAITLLEDSLKNNSTLDLQASTLRLLSKIYRLTGQVDQAIKTQQRLVEVEQALVELTRGTMSPLWESIIAPEDQISVDTNIIGLLNETQGRYKEAIAAYQQAIDAKLNPLAAAEAYIRVATVYKKIDDEKSAIAIYDKFVKSLEQTFVKPSKENKARYNHEKGLMAEAVGWDQEAIALQKKAAELMPEWHIPHLTLRRLYLKLGDQKAADRELDLIRQTSPLNIPNTK